MRFTVEELIKATNAEIKGNLKGNFEISTDTRTIKKGDLYLPLKGANFDGENFCDKAIEAGAAGCFCTKDNCPAECTLKVPDTLTAYLQIANFARKKYNPIVVGITGSSGKTTTKEMVYSVLSEKFKTHKTFSNHNNEIGFCQTVLSMPEDTEVLIVEMGMRGFGEIELITKYAQPDYAIITNAGSAHIGRLGSLDNIAKAKCEITKYLKNTLIAQDNERIKKFADFEGEKIFYSIKDAEILEKRKGYSKFIYKNPTAACAVPLPLSRKADEYELNIEGDYNIENSLSAIELGFKLGMSYEEIKRGLAKYHQIEKRWEVQNVKGFDIINDSYNANPESMKASVSTFLELYKKPVVILGDMGELGENEIEFHRETGEFIGKKFQGKHAVFLTVGKLAKYIGDELSKYGFDVKHFDNNLETSRYILDNLHAGITIFLKASRAMKFEEIIEDLKNLRKG